jgi:hypothetical protein
MEATPVMSRIRTSIAAGISTIAVAAAGTAFAQPGTVAPAAQLEPDVALDTTVDEGVLADVNSDRAWFTPTALTQPKGSWSFHDQELFVVGMTYGITDTFQLSASTLVPVVSDMPLFLWVSGKAQIARSGNLRLALHGLVFHGSEDGDGATVGNLGAAASLCFDAGCHSLINGYASAAFGISEGDTEVPVLFGGAIIARVARRVKLVGEIDTAMVMGDEFVDGYLGWYGVRFTSGEIGADVGFVKPFGGELEDDDNDELPLGLPWLNFTYRAM